RARHGFDDDGGDGRRVVQRHDALEFVGQVGAPGRLAFRERVVFQAVRVRQVVDGGQQRPRESLAVGRYAAYRNAAKAHAVVAALAPDQPGALRVATRAVV